MSYSVTVRETGKILSTLATLEDAEIEVLKFEQIDIDSGVWEPDFYEIIEEDEA